MKNNYNSIITLLIIVCFFIIGVEGYFLVSREKPYASPFSANTVQEDKTTPAVNVNAMRYLSTLLPGAIVSADEVTVYKGDISQIKPSPGTFGSLSYDKAIILKGPKGSSVLLLTQKSLEHLRIIDSSGSNLPFEFLNVGDKISIVETISLIDQSVPIIRRINITKE